ncbi:MAG: flagellar biosynthetic protein FliR [Pseudomonadota bacterium]
MFQGLELQEFFFVFVRTAACVMVLPGLSMSQIPMRVRLYAAVALSISVYLLMPNYGITPSPTEPGAILVLLFHEIVIGVALALPLRFLFSALSFLGEIVVQYIGLNPIPGTPIGEDQAQTTLSSLFSITAVVLMFSTGLLEGFVLAIAQSYEVFPQGLFITAAEILPHFATRLDEFFNIVLRLGSPIIIYAIVLNMLAGLVNKLTPQIPIYFVSTPFLICGGLVFLVWIADDMSRLFNIEVEKLILDL